MVSPEEQSGSFQWQVCLRLDIAFTAKGLARSSNVPTEEGFERLKHLLRYLKGSLLFKVALRPSTTLPAEFGQETGLRVYVNASRAGCLP